jgi:redox-sensitive bicupin YhaK (pirin superfamily)
VLSPTLYVHARVEAGAALPIDDEHEERAIYVVEGALGCDDTQLNEGTMAVLRPKSSPRVVARAASRVMIVGGAKLEGERHIYWNFVSSSQEHIDRARDDWANRRFPSIPGDDVEFVPLPERLNPTRTAT